MEKSLVIGATGQIGSELTLALRKKLGSDNVVAIGHRKKPSNRFTNLGPYESIDARDKAALEKIIKKHKINTIYHLAAILSATGEKDQSICWDVNMNTLKNVLDLAVKYKIKKVFWPSSIASFGSTTPRNKTPQHTILEPTTMYGITKVAGEHLCHYYHMKYKLDVRSIRFPGVISYKTPPGGGTTDYAVEIFHAALKMGEYTCFVRKNTTLPMIYIDDCIKAILKIMNAPKSNITERTSYNLSGVSFSAGELAAEIKKHLPTFKCVYKPDQRQITADSWPASINDTQARHDWGWKPTINLQKMTMVMLEGLKKETYHNTK
jgi:nucleoside-diphosphate-sugar epimerase